MTVGASAKPKAQPLINAAGRSVHQQMATPAAKQSATDSHLIEELKSKNAELDELRKQLAESDDVIIGLEKERDFYFAKLRKIEVLCQDSETTGTLDVSGILQILYETEEENPAETVVDMETFVRDIIKRDARFTTQPKEEESDANFIEEVFTEKPPKILKGYLFGHVIGEGSYSKVKEVIHVRTLERRAVKIVKDRRLRKIPGGEQNVQREIEVLRSLNHRNVVKVVDIFRLEEKQKLYIVMEFCVCSLQQLLDNCSEKMLPEFQAHLYFTQLIEGLDFLHCQRIIHKDIKPGNLLLSLNGVLKICDLGVAELLDTLVGEDGDWCTLVQGTPKFQPPEVVSGTQKKFRGRLVDIWACGVTLYNLVSGCYPFDGDVIMKLFENITSAQLKMPHNVSKPLEQLLAGVLQKDPEKRWNSLKIRASKWFMVSQEIDKTRIVRVPVIKDIPAHRPLGMYDFLSQIYSKEESCCADIDEELQTEVGTENDDITLQQKDEEIHTGLCSPAIVTSAERNERNELTEAARPILATNRTRKMNRRRMAERRKNNPTKILIIIICFVVIIAIVAFFFFYT